MHPRAALLLLLPALLLTGCSGEEAQPGLPETPTVASTPAESPTSAEPASPTTSPGSEPTETAAPEPAGVVVEISIAGDSVSPNGERVEAELGEPVVLRIDSDRAGELHVHSTPEQEIAFGAGRSKHELSFEQPGVVEVEDHDSGRVIVQLQVS